MRTLPALLLGLALALAGCTGDESDGGDGTPTPTPEVNDTPPTNETNETPDGNETGDDNMTGDNETPMTPAPDEVFTGSFDFAEGDPTGAEVQSQTFTVGEGFSKLLLNVTFTPSGVGLGNTLSVSILDASGAEVASCTGTMPMAEAQVCAQESSTAAAGEYTVQAEGAGTVSADVTVTAV